MLSSVTHSPTGRFNDDKATDEEEHDSEDDCEECPAGTHGPKEGADDFDDCRDCQSGKFSMDGAESCIACIAGALTCFDDVLSSCSHADHAAGHRDLL